MLVVGAVERSSLMVADAEWLKLGGGQLLIAQVYVLAQVPQPVRRAGGAAATTGVRYLRKAALITV